MVPTLFDGVDPASPAVIMARSGQVMTYGELSATAGRVAQLFRRCGLGVGDHVALVVENHPMFLPILWGAHAAGLLYTPISTRSTAVDASYVVVDCGARVLITSVAQRDLAREVHVSVPSLERCFMLDGAIDGYESLETAIESLEPVPPPEDRAGRDMLYSSGTTGRPKGVLVELPDAPISAPPSMAGKARRLYGFGDDTVYLSPAPLYHAAPLRFAMAVHHLGGAVVVMDRFDPEEALDAVHRHRVTAAQWVPTMFVRMLKLPDVTRAAYDVSSMTVALHAAAPCPVPVKEQMFEWWGPILYEYYAGTEGNGFTHCTPEDWLGHKGSVGRPLGCSVHIVDEDGAEAPVGEEGTVYFDGGTFEYHNDAQKTAGSRHPRGWTTLGDIGRLDGDGFLYLTDRKAFTIISGGVNVYPQEVEDLLVLHPKVLDAAVFGVPNDDLGEEVKAVVQPASAADAGAELALELLAYCRAHLASYKCPRSVDFEEELPRHQTGKLYKRLLRDRYWEGRGSHLV